jgi:hypothetical protein
MDRGTILVAFIKKHSDLKISLMVNVFLTMALFTCWSVLANNNIEPTRWETWLTSDTLSVSFRPSQYEHLIEIKAQANLRSSLSAFLYFIQSTENVPYWLDNAKSSKLLRQISANENVFITTFKSYWPVTPREMVIQSRYWQNEDLSLEFNIVDAGKLLPKTKGVIRMHVLSSHWTIIPIEHNTIMVTYRFVVDAKGNIPTWLSEPLALNGIWATLSNIEQQLPLAKWQNKIHPNIKELNSP